MPKQQHVLAEHGRWSHRKHGDDIVEYIGIFPADRSEEAFGTARFLNRSHITHSDREPERYSDGYVVRLKADWGDKLARFEEWAMSHGLLPKLKMEIDAREHAALLQEIEAQRMRGLAYKPVPKRFAKDMVGKLNWEVAEAGYGLPNGPMAHTSLVMATENPNVAFQTAFYLMKEGFIDPEHFWRLNTEINADKRTGEGQEYRIAVDGKYFAEFEEKFPKAGERKPALDDAWMKRLASLSEPSVSYSRR
jgi:hypothetical protein